jgi:regulator of replication initiation timing
MNIKQIFEKLEAIENRLIVLQEELLSLRHDYSVTKNGITALQIKLVEKQKRLV